MDIRPVPKLIRRPPREDYQGIKNEFYSTVMSRDPWTYPDTYHETPAELRNLIDSRHNARFLFHPQTIDKKAFPYAPYHVMYHEPIIDRHPHALYGNISCYGTKDGVYNHVALMSKYYMPAVSDSVVVSTYSYKDTSDDVKQDVKVEQSKAETVTPDSTQGTQHIPINQGTNASSTQGGGESKAQQSTAKKYRYTCDVCGKSFSRSNTLTTHKRIHTGAKPFHCEQCGRAFRQPGNLTRHRLTHTAIKPYVCPQCNKAFNRASNLHTHMRTHTNYKPFVCDFCGKGFHQKIDMKIHRYTHTGEKPHKCTKCGRGFKQLTHLTYHMRTHSDERLYKCEYCGKGFNQKGNLQAHIYGHTGERPFKCDICGKGFTLASTLNTHKRTHATKKPFNCQFCDKAFYQKNALKTHYIASHPFANGVSLL